MFIRSSFEFKSIKKPLVIAISFESLLRSRRYSLNFARLLPSVVNVVSEFICGYFCLRLGHTFLVGSMKR